MPPEDETPQFDPNSGDVSEDELRKILGDDYDSVVGGMSDEPTSGSADAAAPSGGSSGGDAPSAASSGAGMPSWEAGASGGAPSFGSSGSADGAGFGRAVPEIQPLAFGQLEGSGEGSQHAIDLLLDVKLPISVELGRTEMLVKEILECGPGTVIELNKMAGEPVDVFVNGRMVAQGEVVRVDEHFGVRVTNLLSPRDRVKSLA
jgi:flagellar motor switch protein FliN